MPQTSVADATEQTAEPEQTILKEPKGESSSVQPAAQSEGLEVKDPEHQQKRERDCKRGEKGLVLHYDSIYECWKALTKVAKNICVKTRSQWHPTSTHQHYSKGTIRPQLMTCAASLTVVHQSLTLL